MADPVRRAEASNESKGPAACSFRLLLRMDPETLQG